MVGEGRGCEDVGTSPVEFAYDAFGCCVLSLTREALAEVRAGAVSATKAAHLTCFSVIHINKAGEHSIENALCGDSDSPPR